jgi:hypothetical protein
MITVIFNISVDHISLTFLHVTHTAYVSDMENDMLTFSVFFLCRKARTHIIVIISGFYEDNPRDKLCNGN